LFRHTATIHKSQASEYQAVVIPILTQHYPILQRNLLYTGITRGKRLVVLVGQKKAVAIAVQRLGSSPMVQAAGMAQPIVNTELCYWLRRSRSRFAPVIIETADPSQEMTPAGVGAARR
jgi:hypothetical protein